MGKSGKYIAVNKNGVFQGYVKKCSYVLNNFKLSATKSGAKSYNTNDSIKSDLEFLQSCNNKYNYTIE